MTYTRYLTRTIEGVEVDLVEWVGPGSYQLNHAWHQGGKTMRVWTLTDESKYDPFKWALFLDDIESVIPYGLIECDSNWDALKTKGDDT